MGPYRCCCAVMPLKRSTKNEVLRQKTSREPLKMPEPIIPWSASGVYCATMLGVATLDYLPWAILCYSGVIFALLWAATGIGIAKYEPNEATENMVEQKS